MPLPQPPTLNPQNRHPAPADFFMGSSGSGSNGGDGSGGNDGGGNGGGGSGESELRVGSVVAVGAVYHSLCVTCALCQGVDTPPAGTDRGGILF